MNSIGVLSVCLWECVPGVLKGCAGSGSPPLPQGYNGVDAARAEILPFLERSMGRPGPLHAFDVEGN